MDVKAHYCHGKLASISVGFKEESCCCKKKTTSKCCTSKEVSLKIQEKQIKTADVVFSAKHLVLIAILRTNNLFIFSSKLFAANSFRLLSYPLHSTLSLLVLHQVFRI
jgi:hypothetical protein